MTENNMTANNPTEQLKNDPDFQSYLRQKKAAKLIEEYEKDSVMKEILDAGLRDQLKERPEIIDSDVALSLAIETAKKEVVKKLESKKQTEASSDKSFAEPHAQSAQQSNDFMKRSIFLSSVKEIQEIAKIPLAEAIDIKVFGVRKQIIDMS